ncbi:MAG: NADH-quinone oxidoreductase subunit NuoH [Phototrophicaceae bacterium]|jgi:NADH-quinone oxidoreductase subunit H
MTLVEFLLLALRVAIVAVAPLLIVIFLIWFERRFAARVQDRLGPNRVGPNGLFQTFADAIKLVLKEDITPAGTDKVAYNLSPIIAVMAVVLIWAALPLSPRLIGVNVEIGVLYIVAVASLGTLAIMMAGWSSNNKYALLGAFRSVAQLVSYEVPLVMSLLIPVMLASSLGMQNLVLAQQQVWFVFMAPVAAFIFFISSQAETGRGPFDLIEAESELVAGFNIEYSGMKFGLFFAGEFAHVFTNGILMANLFLGGWWGLGVSATDGSILSDLLGVFYVVLKAMVFYLFSLLLRNSMPRVRIDQMMNFNWKFLVPVSIVNLLVTAFLLKLAQLGGFGIAPGQIDLLTNANPINLLPVTLLLLGGNVVVILGTLAVFGRQTRTERLATERAAVAVGD